MGAYFEMAVALALFRLSQHGEFDISLLFDNAKMENMILPQFNYIKRVSTKILTKKGIQKGIIYALPQATGVDLIVKDISDRIIMVQFKNWYQMISHSEMRKIIDRFKDFDEQLNKKGIHVLILSKHPDQPLLDYASRNNLFIISNAERLLGQEILQFFEQARKRAREIEPLVVTIASGFGVMIDA